MNQLAKVINEEKVNLENNGHLDEKIESLQKQINLLTDLTNHLKDIILLFRKEIQDKTQEIPSKINNMEK